MICLEIFKLPEVGVSIKESKFKRVDFPEPDGPTKEYIFTFFRTLVVGDINGNQGLGPEQPRDSPMAVPCLPGHLHFSYFWQLSRCGLPRGIGWWRVKGGVAGPLAGQLIKSGGLVLFVAVTGQVGIALVVGKDDQNIGLFSRHHRGTGKQNENRKKLFFPAHGRALGR